MTRVDGTQVVTFDLTELIVNLVQSLVSSSLNGPTDVLSLLLEVFPSLDRREPHKVLLNDFVLLAELCPQLPLQLLNSI